MSKKNSLWASYNTLLIQRPFTTNLVQSGLIAAAGNVTAQLAQNGTIAVWPLAEQVLLTMGFINPVVQAWFPILGSMGLHWISATAVDQFLFSPLFNIGIFWFMAAFLKGGVGLSAAEHRAQTCTAKIFGPHCTPDDAVERYELSLALYPETFPPLSEYHPVWSTQVNAYYVWLPATLVREAFVPPHLKGIFVNACAFVWNIIFSFILAA